MRDARRTNQISFRPWTAAVALLALFAPSALAAAPAPASAASYSSASAPASSSAAAEKPRTQPVYGLADLERVHGVLSEFAAGGPETRDYYFVLIGDIQNDVRSYRKNVFDAIAADMMKVSDAGGASLYERIKFVILLGDMVYEGPSPKQWDWLERIFAGESPDGGSYPNIKKLAEEKPFIPALGNHELFEIRPGRETRYRDFCGSPAGVAGFKRFFRWDDFIRSPYVLYPVPSDLDRAAFHALIAGLASAEDRGLLEESYVPGPDGRVRLKLFVNPPLDEAAFRAASDGLAGRLAAVFRKAGYGTLPVLSSDNMINFAFEAGGVLYVVLDSMARGWQYPGFAGLKESLYPKKGLDRHRLNLFTKSPYNGQGMFYLAAEAYARERGLTIIPMMHHSAFNNTRMPTAAAAPYNTWLAMGFPIRKGEPGAETIFDDIIFGGATHTFSACVHGYERFDIVASRPDGPPHTLHWTISGGGAEVRRNYYEVRMRMTEDLYNAKLGSGQKGAEGRSIKVENDVTGVGIEYLLVHVKDGQLVEVAPHFLKDKDIPKPANRPNVVVSAVGSSGPGAGGANVDFIPGIWGAGKVLPDFMSFANIRPTVGFGVLDYDAAGAKLTVFSLSLSPFKLEAHIPGSNVVILEPLALEYWAANGGRRRAFLRTGLEAPLLFNFFGVLEKVELGLKAMFPVGGGGSDPDFGAKFRLALSVGYRFRI